MTQFTVYVSNDLRVPDRDYDMGLGALYGADDIEVEFLTTQNHDVLRSEDLAGANALVAIQQHVTPETLDGLDDLKLVSAFGAGLDHIDIGACTERGIAVVNAPQPVGRAVAQSTLGMLITCASNAIELDNHLRTDGFANRISLMGHTLYGKTVGTVGMGMIGSNVVDLLEPFDVEILTHDPYLSEERADELGVTLVDLDTLLAESDFVSLHCPLTEETKGMLGTEQFKQMKESAYLVNTTRGGLYADAELAEAVEEGWIAGAAVDVFEDEPNVAGNPLLDLDDCLMTPHMAGVLIETMTEQGEIVSEAILARLHDEVPANLVNPDVYAEPVDEALLSPSHR
ncbi:NAD(P)-dependent oxidoreductase [Halorarius litoreus]|uniref:NAD(P)-dependent oxidoreductase n=1 Tax=Halorarius litoreus TaxID=2962676 RepID=UPI0020CF3F4A|nr:NAD(P)-dependent oxidoreductase [Halorarius litoreus]